MPCQSPTRSFVLCLLVVSTALGVPACYSSPGNSRSGLAAQATGPSPVLPTPGAANLVLRGIPHVRQRPDFCGEACVEMVLRGHPSFVDQDEVFALSRVDPALGRGAYTKELAVAVREIGFDPGPIWTKVRQSRPADLARQWRALVADLARGVPSMVCMRYDERPRATEHFRLIVGHDAAKDEIIYHEPAEPDGVRLRMSRALFLELWPLHDESGRSTVIRFALDRSQLPEGGSPAVRRTRELRRVVQSGFLPADFSQHVRELKARLPRGDWTIVVEEPFVVIGDESAARVRSRAQNTVRWASRHFQELYFDRYPSRILDVWLFRDEASYRRGAKKLWGEEPDTPFGYYSATHGALVMNIATGGGTLVHEIAHPFMESNFSACPAWFNEGLASLYEQCAERRGKMIGLTNWRLDGLQKAIQAGNVPSFRTLMSTTRHEFYREDPGTNYAQARYLCYYLQEMGELERFYDSFVRGVAQDPTGYKTLQEVLGEKNVPAFQKRWETWVLGLRFRS